MKKVLFSFILLMLVFGNFTSVYSKHGTPNDRRDNESIARNHASISNSEYAHKLSGMFGKDVNEVMTVIQQENGMKINRKAVIKHHLAAQVLASYLPVQVERWFTPFDNSQLPVKERDLNKLSDPFKNGWFDHMGTYSGRHIDGHAWINHSDVTLTDTLIEGDLVIVHGENILLDHVTVQGTVFIHESVQNQIVSKNSDLGKVVVYDPKEEPSEWSLVWTDEFISHVVDDSKWTYEIGNWIIDEEGTPISPGWGNNELQYYTDSKDNSFIKEGNLIIRAQKEETPITDSYGSYAYTSAKLTTKGLFSKKYGRFEARMKLPEGQGYWPAFWMMPEDDVYGTWPTSGEIDIMEAAGNDPSTIGGTIHYGEAYPDNTYKSSEYKFPQGENFTDFHTYAIEWEPGEIRWYVDGVLYQTLNEWFSKGENQGDKYSFPAPFDQEFHLILNLAVGGWYGGNPDQTTEFPGSMAVDYVRVYELTGREYKEPNEPVVKEEVLPEDAKQPLEDGNLIYDQAYKNSFRIIDQPEDTFHPTEWNFVKLPDFGGSGSVSVVDLDGIPFAKTTIADKGNALWSLQQIQHLPVLEGHTYKVTFDAKADQERSFMTKVSGGAERGFANYSGEKSVTLSSDVEKYTYTFKMNQDTDLEARLEFNMGGINTVPVYIGNVRVEDITDLVRDDHSKPVLGDGNLIYNGTFDQGDMLRLDYWDLAVKSGASAEVAVPETTREAVIKIDHPGEEQGDIIFKQAGLPLERQTEYVLTFKAKASENRTIHADLWTEKNVRISGDATTTVSLTNEWKEYEIRFNTPAEEIGDTGQLQFSLGGQQGDVSLDDVRIVKASEPVDPNPIRNGDFSQELTGWTPYIHFDATAEMHVEEGALIADITNAGNEVWSVLIEQGNLDLREDVDYLLSFQASSTQDREIEVTIENDAYQRYFSETIILGQEMQTYQFDVRMPANDQVSLKFLLGQFNEKHEIKLDHVSVRVQE